MFTSLGINIGMVIIILVLLVVDIEVSLQSRKEKKIRRTMETYIDSNEKKMKLLQRQISNVDQKMIDIEYTFESFRRQLKKEQKT